MSRRKASACLGSNVPWYLPKVENEDDECNDDADGDDDDGDDGEDDDDDNYDDDKRYI